MSYGISAGVYPREQDQSFIVPAVANSIGAIVINSDRGPSNEVTLITSNKQFIETFGKPIPTNMSMYSALAFLEQAKRLYVVRVINDAAAATYSVLDTQATPQETFAVSAANEGSWGNNLTITIKDADATDQIFTITIKDGGTQVEEFRVSKNSTLLDGYGNSMYIEDVINNQSQYIRVTDDPANTELPDLISDQSLSGGSNDTTAPTDSDINTGWDLFANKNETEISLMINGGWASETVQTKMITVAESRQDAIAILDLPNTVTTVADMENYSNTTLNADSSYAALYGPWVKIYDQYNDKLMYVPPSGYVAGVYAHTAEVSEVWYAPAGSRRGSMNVLGTKIVFTEGERDTLYSSNVNPIQTFTGEGIQVYGQKTLSRTPSALDRVNVRMLMITIEKAISRSLRPFVFEFNDAFTRENITSIISNYMEDIKTRRGVYDFLVTCDESNNTPQVIDQNKLIVDLYVKPTRVAEFIRLNAVITSTGAQFSQ